MADRQDKIKALNRKLDILLLRQEEFAREIAKLQVEIGRLSGESAKHSPDYEEVYVEKPISANTDFITRKEEITEATPAPERSSQQKKTTRARKPRTAQQQSDLEKFIGENLISKIGIGVLIIGVGIGAKYSIEHNLVSPLTRIILGYLTGLGLLGVGVKLKKNYEQYSAVLVSGAMAIMYFITYFAYSFYELIPQPLAFGLMLLFTAVTVFAALNYNRQVIAVIGLVGAYAVPFLLSDGSGKVAILFSYMTIINIGILVIAFRKYWRSLYYTSFVLTWTVYAGWLAFSYQMSEHYALALIFLSLFFIIFYGTFTAYKLSQNAKLAIGDTVLILVNSFVFFALGYITLEEHPTGQQLLGLFALANALLHFLVSIVVFKRKLSDKKLFFLVSGLALVFATITIPIQLDGNWVTLLWAGEAALLFWIGRTKNVSVYEKLSIPLMILAFFSLVQDWLFGYFIYYPTQAETRITPIFNILFLTSIIFVGVFAFINWLNRNKQYQTATSADSLLSRFITYLLPTILLVSVYFAFFVEIYNYWFQLFQDSTVTGVTDDEGNSLTYKDYDLYRYQVVWLINYTLLFVSLLGLINFIKLKNRIFGYINLVLVLLAIVIFLSNGLYVLSELRESYLQQTLAEYYTRGAFNIGIRYLSLLFVAMTLVVSFQYSQQQFMKLTSRVIFDFVLHVSLLWIASSELIHWMDMGRSTHSYKLGLSILWGIYSLLLIVLGIWKKKKHLRYGAIGLFGITLIKLFFYDIAHLNTISKTIVFVSLGVLLLTISFLYNKYKNIIADERSE